MGSKGKQNAPYDGICTKFMLFKNPKEKRGGALDAPERQKRDTIQCRVGEGLAPPVFCKN